MSNQSLKPFVVPLAAGLIAIAYFSYDGSGSSVSKLEAIVGPPADVSREYAKQLIEAQPHPAGEQIYVLGGTVNCLSDMRHIQRFFGKTSIEGKGRSYLQSIQWIGQEAISPLENVSEVGVSVSGVRDLGDGRKLIEYQGNLEFSTPAGNNHCFSSLSQETRTAVAEKYDDGWRIRYVAVRKR